MELEAELESVLLSSLEDEEELDEDEDDEDELDEEELR